MTMGLRVVEYGTGLNVDLSSLLVSCAWLEEFVPVTAAADAETAVETVRATFYGGNATVIANLGRLEYLFEHARLYADYGLGSRVYLEVTIGAVVEVSTLHRGQIDLGDGVWRYEQANGERTVTLTLVRDAWWEQEIGAFASFNNANGAGGAVFNINDGTGGAGSVRVNTATIIGASVLGSEVAPALLQLVCQAGAGVDFIITGNFTNLPASVVDWHEGESFSGGAVVADAARSAGNVLEVSGISTSAWSTISKALTQVVNGQGHKFIAAISPTTKQGYFLRPYWYDGLIYHYGPMIYKDWTSLVGSYQLVDLGIMRIPAIVPVEYYPNVTAGIQIKAATTGAATVRVDFVQITCADFVMSSMGLQQGGTVGAGDLAIFDKWGNALWKQGPNSKNVMRTFGSGLWLKPGLDLRLTFNSCGFVAGADQGAHVIKQYALQIVYYARRRTLA